MKAEVVLDLQYGSTGKGLVCAKLGETGRFDAAVCAWGPNSGHTAFSGQHKCVHTMLPISAIAHGGPTRLFMAPGSLVSLDGVIDDAHSLSAVRPHEHFKVHIHEHASWVTADCASNEQRYAFKIGSTQKGTGEALIRKLRREGMGGVMGCDEATRALSDFTASLSNVEIAVVSAAHWETLLHSSKHVLVEGAQGFSLGLNSGFYPYCTTRECTLAQILSDCLMAPSQVVKVWGVARTFPIRVANRYDASGIQIGSSGPCFSDQRELSWEDVGMPAETTTVTKLPRRVFSFSMNQIRQALKRNDVTDLVLNFCNYFDASPDWCVRKSFDLLCDIAESSGQRTFNSYLGFGPLSEDVLPVDLSQRPSADNNPLIARARMIKKGRPELFPGGEYDV